MLKMFEFSILPSNLSPLPAQPVRIANNQALTLITLNTTLANFNDGPGKARLLRSPLCFIFVCFSRNENNSEVKKIIFLWLCKILAPYCICFSDDYKFYESSISPSTFGSAFEQNVESPFKNALIK